MVDRIPSPIRRWFGTPTAVHASMLSPEAKQKVGADGYVERHVLRDRLGSADWRAEWKNAVARGRAQESGAISARAVAIADATGIPGSGHVVKQVIDTTDAWTDKVTRTVGLDRDAAEVGKAAVTAGFTTPLTKSALLGDVAFSTASNVAESLLRSGLDERAEQVDAATAITYDVTSGAAAGVVGTLVGVVATPPVGIAAAIATKIGIDAVRDPVVWRVAELWAGARAALRR